MVPAQAKGNNWFWHLLILGHFSVLFWLAESSGHRCVQGPSLKHQETLSLTLLMLLWPLNKPRLTFLVPRSRNPTTRQRIRTNSQLTVSHIEWAPNRSTVQLSPAQCAIPYNCELNQWLLFYASKFWSVFHTAKQTDILCTVLRR